MNLEQLQEMSDIELNELSAVKVMGWSVHEVPHTKFYEDAFGDATVALDAWNPTSDMNDCFMLVKSTLQQYRVEIIYVEGVFVCNIFEDDIKLLHSVETDNPARSITIASILAMEE